MRLFKNVTLQCGRHCDIFAEKKIMIKKTKGNGIPAVGETDLLRIGRYGLILRSDVYIYEVFRKNMRGFRIRCKRKSQTHAVGTIYSCRDSIILDITRREFKYC